MAQIKVAEASLEPCKLNLAFCKVVSPIDGRVSRANLTPGNLVTQDKTVLTTIVSLDPMYAYFNVNAPTLLRVRQATKAGLLKANGAGHIPIFMGLPDEEGSPHKGEVNFVNNQVNPATGSVLARGIFGNPVLSGGYRLLMPGMYARIRLPIGQPHKALLVIDRAIGSDQGSKYVYLVNAQGEIEYNRIETGPLESDGLRVVTKGLNADDQVVVSGPRLIHPGVKVNAEEIPMPLLDGRATEKSKPRAGTLQPDSVSGGTPPAGSAAAGNQQSSGADNQKAPKK